VKKGKKKTDVPKDDKLIDLGFDPIASSPSVEETSPISSVPFEDIASPEQKEQKRKSKKISPKKSTTKSKKSSKEGTKKKETTKSSKKEKQNTEPISTAPESPRVAQAKPVSRFKPLCSDDMLSVLYELRVNPNESKKFLCALAIKNRSQGDVSSIQVDIKGTLNTKISGGSSSKAEFTLSPDQADTHNILLDIQNIEQSQKLSGMLVYTANESTNSKDFQLIIPSSTFIIPIKLQVEEFFAVLKTGSLSLAGTDVKLESDIRTFVVNLAVLLRVELITMDDKGAALYGKSIQGHHVAVYVKVPPLNSPTVHLDIKSSSASLASSLASEVTGSFR